MIDYCTREQRLAPSTDPMAHARRYIEQRRISVLHHGFRPSPACDTDVRRTWRRHAAETGQTLPEWLLDPADVLPANDCDLPAFLRQQAD